MNKKLNYLINNYLLRILPDKQFLKLKYYLKFKKKLNLKNPETFNEKLQWLKLYNRKDIFSKMVDKYEVKSIVSDIIGSDYIIKTIGIYNSLDDIDFSKLPNQFVIKCTHDSGGIIICKNKETFNLKNERNIIDTKYKTNYYYEHREWPYKNVKPRIIVEEYMEDKIVHELRDYKIYNFNGEPKYIQVDYNRFVDHKRKIFDLNWKECNFKYLYPSDNTRIQKPQNLELMINLAKKISKNIPFLRTDFYEINGKVYFGETTFFPEAGFGNFEPNDVDMKLGKLIDLDYGWNNEK